MTKHARLITIWLNYVLSAELLILISMSHLRNYTSNITVFSLTDLTNKDIMTGYESTAMFSVNRISIKDEPFLFYNKLLIYSGDDHPHYYA